jgi:hypothetical protein
LSKPYCLEKNGELNYDTASKIIFKEIGSVINKISDEDPKKFFYKNIIYLFEDGGN